MKLSDLAEKTGAHVEGDADVEIESAAGLDQAGHGEVTFLANFDFWLDQRPRGALGFAR